MQLRSASSKALKAKPAFVAKASFRVNAAAVSHPYRILDRDGRARVARSRPARSPASRQYPSHGTDRTRDHRIFPPNAHSDATLTLTFLFSSIQQSDDTLTKVRTIISEQLGTDLDAVAADAKFVDLGADSLDTVEIMMALEEQFEITLDEEGAEKIATVQEAADMIQEQMA